jgi:hypothetical protein
MKAKSLVAQLILTGFLNKENQNLISHPPTVKIKFHEKKKKMANKEW